MSSRNLADCTPVLRIAAQDIIQKYNNAFSDGRVLRPICTLRSTDEQFNIWKVGRTWVMQDGVPHELTADRKKILTTVDGYTKFSKHNPDPVEPLAKAVDFGVFVGGKYITDNTYYYPLLQLARDAGVVSGIDFRQSGLDLATLIADKTLWKDVPHIEVPGPLYHPL